MSSVLIFDIYQGSMTILTMNHQIKCTGHGLYCCVNTYDLNIVGHITNFVLLRTLILMLIKM